MYCKNCGNKLEQNARFCGTCGAQVEAPQNNFTAPKPFEKNSVDGSQNYQYQKSTFQGKQYSTGTSGSVSFGNGPKKRGFFGKLIRFGIFAVVAIVVYFVIMSFFGAEISNIETGTGIDLVLEEIVGETDTFATTTPEIYVLFDMNLETGTRLWVNLFYEDETMSIESFYFDVTDEMGGGYVTFTMPSGGWTTGTYYIEFVVDEVLLVDHTFTVE